MGHRIICYISISIVIFVALLLPYDSQAAPGDLDPSFGNGGIVVTPVIDSPVLVGPASIILQPDGKILVCGQFDNYDVLLTSFIARYEPSGTPDTSFGYNGMIVGDLILGHFEAVGYDIALQPDGKIIAVGLTKEGFGPYEFTLRRYNPNGTLDLNVTTTITADGAAWNVVRVMLMPDGKMVVAGTEWVGGYANSDFVLLRYGSDGELDNTFGTGGVVTNSNAGNDWLSGIVLQPDGKVIVYGSQSNAGVLLRYNTTGSLDNTFGSDGKVVLSWAPEGVILQPDGKIVAAGSLYPDTKFARLNADGSRDTSFGVDGIFTPDSSFAVGSRLALQPDGKILAFGSAPVPGNPNILGIGVARLNPDGSPDTGFGTAGRSVTQIGTTPYAYAAAGAIQSDGKILAFGDATVEGYVSNPQIAIVRYLTSASVQVSGRVSTPDGRGLRNAKVSLTDSHGLARSVTTSSFGFYRFDDVSTGGLYTIRVASKLYRFSSREVQVDSALSNVDFTGME